MNVFFYHETETSETQRQRAITMSRGSYTSCVSDLLGEALLGLDLVVLLCRHPGDAGRGRPRQRLHLLDGFHGNALGKHLEE